MLSNSAISMVRPESAALFDLNQCYSNWDSNELDGWIEVTLVTNNPRIQLLNARLKL